MIIDLRCVALVLMTSVLANTAAAQDDGGRTIEFETTEVTAPDVAITPDGAALLYAAGNKIWRQPLVGRAREEIPIRLPR